MINKDIREIGLAVLFFDFFLLSGLRSRPPSRSLLRTFSGRFHLIIFLITYDGIKLSYLEPRWLSDLQLPGTTNFHQTVILLSCSRSSNSHIRILAGNLTLRAANFHWTKNLPSNSRWLALSFNHFLDFSRNIFFVTALFNNRVHSLLKLLLIMSLLVLTKTRIEVDWRRNFLFALIKIS